MTSSIAVSQDVVKVRQINFKVSVKPGEIKLTEHDAFKWISVDEISNLKDQHRHAGLPQERVQEPIVSNSL